MKRILILEENFSSAHLYKNDSFSKKVNEKYFGRCFTEHGHGHNYKLEVGFLIPPTTTDADFLKINSLLHKKLFSLTDKLDHKHLNFDIPEFKKTIPTTENIILYLEKQILKFKLKYKLNFLRLYESQDLFSEIIYE